MRLILEGHEYKYAVEQILLMMFPEERPEYDGAAGDTYARVKLTRGGEYLTGVTRLYYGGAEYRGVARSSLSGLDDELKLDRAAQRIIKLSFFRAAVACTGKMPVWGAMTGIRPAKIAAGFLEQGFSRRKAERMMSSIYYVSEERARLCTDAALESLRVKGSLGSRDAAIYVGVPFCPTRCAYCSFVSHSVEKSMKLVPPFVDALLREVEAVGRLTERLGLNIISVYFGGGTPTTLSADDLRRVIASIRRNIDMSSVREFTVEAGRPDTITEEKLASLKEGGVDRLSVNPQTMSDDVLRAIGRRHSSDDVRRAMELVRKAGFGCVNMDLIAGLPLDTADGFEKTLREVMKMSPENITVHTLALKKGSRITLEGTPIPDGDEVGRMLDISRDMLTGGGFSPYYLYRQKFMSGGFENVGWSLKGYENLYNVLIMEELCTILALGGGGVTKLVDTGSGRIERVFNAKYPYEYVDRIEKIISDKSKIDDFYSSLGTECV